jgi:hypothetical protein
VIEWAIALATALFTAGVTWGLLQASLKQLRGNLNGIGVKVRDGQAADVKRQARVTAAILASCPDDKRVEIAKLLKD